MDRFKSLPGVIFGTDGQPPKYIEELALVIGLAADKVKTEVEQSHQSEHRQNWMLALVLLIGSAVIVTLGVWWALSRGIPNVVPILLGAGAFVLVFILVVVSPLRPKNTTSTRETAAVTRLGRFYWPVGILPLSSDRGVLWDPLTQTDGKLHIMTVPAEYGAESEEAVASAERASEAFKVLLNFSEGLEGIQPQAIPWPGNEPDDSTKRLGQDVSHLWQQMIPITLEEAMPAVPPATVEHGSDWMHLDTSSEHLHEFYTAITTLRTIVDTYRQRAADLVDAAREVLVDRHWRVLNQVEQDRTEHFAPSRVVSALGERSLPTSPNESLLLTPADTMNQVQESVRVLQTALQPLDKAVQSALQQYEQDEVRELQVAEQRFMERRRELDDDKRRLDLLDSDILKLGQMLDEQQEKIRQYALTVLQGFKEIAEVPLNAVREQLLALQHSIDRACLLIDDVAQKIELEEVERTLGSLQAVTQKAQTEWLNIAEEMPKRSSEVNARVDRISEQLTHLMERPEVGDQDILQQIEISVKDVQRVSRVVVSWAAAQEDPITPVEDKERELATHLVALRDQRHKLESSSAILDALTAAGSPEPLTLLTGLTRVEQTLTAFMRLSDQTTTTVAAMDNSAAAVKLQAERLSKLLRERDDVSGHYNAKLTAFQQEEQLLIADIRERWQAERLTLEGRRATLDRLTDAVGQRFARARQVPAVERMGLLQDEASAHWPDLIVNQMGHGIDLWGQRVAGLDYAEGETLIDRVRRDLEECFDEINARAVPMNLPESKEALRPQLCFVPFWLVETEDRPGDVTNPGKRLHLFPPLKIAPRTPTEQPQVEELLYPELNRRLMTYVRQDFSKEQVTVDALSFGPAALSEKARKLDIDAAAPALQALAVAISHHLIFFRTTDEALKRVINNSLNALIPETQILEAWAQSTQLQQPAITDRQQQRQLPKQPANKTGVVVYDDGDDDDVIEGVRVYSEDD
ncbi:MAG: hypothetical protein H0T73_06870 [Ardenticatenales bacterium]|nr:hypothetical protein [Ardenticatenales bacterium]